MRLRFLHIVLCVFLMLMALTVYAADEKKDEVPRFDINRYQVEGNTLLDKAKVEKLLVPYTGKGKDFGTVQEAIEALEKAYHSHGYSMVVVALPEQEMEKGVVRLKVIESIIGKISVEGNRYFDKTNILRSLPGLRQRETPDIGAVSRSLKLANESPAKKINLQMLSGDKENEVDAHIDVKDERPWKVGISGDNTGTTDTGPTRLGILLEHANVFNRDHLLTLQYITSPEKIDKVSIYSVGYRVPLYSLGASVDFIGAYSNVNQGTINAGSSNMDVSGKGTILGLHYNQNLTRMGIYEHKAILGVDYRAYENNVNFLGNPVGTNVTVHPVSLTYAGTVTTEKLNAGFYLTDIQNLPGSWGDGRDGEDNFLGAPRGYNMIRYGANATYTIGVDWQMRALINGQFTGDQLVTGEQYGIGGATTVRGFPERATSGEQGYSGSVEIYTPDLSKLVRISAFQTRLLVFYDRGEVSSKNQSSTEIASVGPGIRITDGKRFSLSADLGIVVDPGAENTPTETHLKDNTTRGSQVWHLSGSILF
jgi:hemolysin activation/secretion protein